MTRYNKRGDFEAGLAVLSPFFGSLDYTRAIADVFLDKEGAFYSAKFTRVARSVEVHHLYSLGPVIYRIGDFHIQHTPYLEALGVASAARYPCNIDDSISDYVALLEDLRSLLSPFFVGPEDAFLRIASPFMERERQKSVEQERRFAYWGALEENLKIQARELFLQKRYGDVVGIESRIRFPEFLTKPERHIFEQARRHLEK